MTDLVFVTGGDWDSTTLHNNGFELAAQQPGFLGVESAREDGLGITVSYWSSEEAIRAWKHHAEHSAIREQGRSTWYTAFQTRVCKVERAYAFSS